jgi:hypothetical protein
MRSRTAILLVFMICGSEPLWAVQPGQQPLFKIERNTNVNIIQYDAQIDADGRLDRKKPVVAYWVRHAEQGQIKELSWVQNKFAYGFTADIDAASNSVTLDMAADIDRPIEVRLDKGEYLAISNIDGQLSRLLKIFIHATGKGMSTTVDFIELHGTSLHNKNVTYERFVP